MPLGLLNFAFIPFALTNPFCPPAKILTTPFDAILLIQLFPASATKIFPDASIAIP
jgi:hypothetical protein